MVVAHVAMTVMVDRCSHRRLDDLQCLWSPSQSASDPRHFPAPVISQSLSSHFPVVVSFSHFPVAAPVTAAQPFSVPNSPLQGTAMVGPSSCGQVEPGDACTQYAGGRRGQRSTLLLLLVLRTTHEVPCGFTPAHVLVPCIFQRGNARAQLLDTMCSHAPSTFWC